MRTPMPLSPRLLTDLTRKVVLLTLLCMCTGAHAADNSAAAAAALKILTTPMGTSTSLMAAPETSEPVLTRPSVTVQRGEGLDAVIRRTWPGLPFKDDFMRRSFMRVNPQVYPQAKLRPLRPGTTLQVPTPDDVRQMLKEQSPWAANMLLAAPEPTDEAGASSANKALDKRRWVRFP